MNQAETITSLAFWSGQNHKPDQLVEWLGPMLPRGASRRPASKNRFYSLKKLKRT